MPEFINLVAVFELILWENQISDPIYLLTTC